MQVSTKATKLFLRYLSQVFTTNNKERVMKISTKASQLFLRYLSQLLTATAEQYPPQLRLLNCFYSTCFRLSEATVMEEL
jgi:site-specific recombinase XerD